MNLTNLDDQPTPARPINSMLIDKPLLKPIDLLVERPIDANVVRNTNRKAQPIVERFVEQAYDETDSHEEDEPLPRETRDLGELMARPKIKPATRLKDKAPRFSNDHELDAEQREKKRNNARRRPDTLDDVPLSSHILSELDNPDVVAKIKLIINDNVDDKSESQEDVSEELSIAMENNRILELENQSLTDQLDKALIEVKKLKKIAINLKEEKNEYMNKTETMLTEHKKLFSKVQKFEYDQKMFRLFTLLNQEVKASLRGIFKVDTYENFIACGSQRSNIDSLWDFAKNRVQKQQFEEIETLNQILLYFIDIFNQTSNTPTIKIQEVAIGQNFDTEAHIKSSDSIKPAGAINKIYLLGYQNVTNDKILNKAIVLIGG